MLAWVTVVPVFFFATRNHPVTVQGHRYKASKAKHKRWKYGSIKKALLSFRSKRWETALSWECCSEQGTHGKKGVGKWVLPKGDGTHINFWWEQARVILLHSLTLFGSPSRVGVFSHPSGTLTRALPSWRTVDPSRFGRLNLVSTRQTKASRDWDASAANWWWIHSSRHSFTIRFTLRKWSNTTHTWSYGSKEAKVC